MSQFVFLQVAVTRHEGAACVAVFYAEVTLHWFGQSHKLRNYQLPRRDHTPGLGLLLRGVGYQEDPLCIHNPSVM